LCDRDEKGAIRLGGPLSFLHRCAAGHLHKPNGLREHLAGLAALDRTLVRLAAHYPRRTRHSSDEESKGKGRGGSRTGSLSPTPPPGRAAALSALARQPLSTQRTSIGVAHDPTRVRPASGHCAPAPGMSASFLPSARRGHPALRMRRRSARVDERIGGALSHATASLEV
jgi:hypothetical protein